MRKLLMFAVCAVVALPLASIGGEKKRFDGEVSQWVSGSPSTSPDGTLIPIGGSGQVNGDFVVSERNGIQIGIRAQRRFLQNVAPLPNVKEKNVGVYLADTGFSDGLGRATWNFDIHVDLRGGFGVAKGKTLDDYTLTLDTDIGETIFGFSVPFNVAELYIPTAEEVLLFQTSQNPRFGNPTFNAAAEGTYHFTLTLTPTTFNGAPIVAAMSVEVIDP
jgi:hypothetical protein